MLSGDNSILQRATDAKTRTERQSIVEQARTDVLGYQVENKGGDLIQTQLKSVLETYFKEVPTELPDGDELLNLPLTKLDKYGTHTITVSEIYNGNISKQEDSRTVKISYSFNINTITMNFEQNLEDIFVKLAKAYGADYYTENYPEQEITLNLIYQDANVSNLQEFVSNWGYTSTTDLIMSFSGNDGFDDIVGGSGTITLKKETQ